MSRIGRMPIAIPAGVEIKVADDNTVTVKGPKGTLTRTLHADMIIKQEAGQVVIERPTESNVVTITIRTIHFTHLCQGCSVFSCILSGCLPVLRSMKHRI